MTYGNLFIFVFWSPIAVGLSVLPTKMTYGNLFIFVFLESHICWPNKDKNSSWNSFGFPNGSATRSTV